MANLSAKDIVDLEEKFYSPKPDTPFFTPGSGFDEGDDDSSADEKESRTIFFMDPKMDKFPKRIGKKYPSTVYADLYDPQNAQDVSEYIEEIMDRLFDQELEEQQGECKITSDDINTVMFRKLVDWLVAVHGKFKLSFETFLLCVWLLKYCLGDDDFKSLKRGNLQLLGCTCMYIASKVEETRYNLPNPKDYVYISDKAFTVKDLLKMEQEVLKTVQFRVNMVTPFQFYKTFTKIVNQQPQALKLTRYLLMYICLDFKLLCTWLPSQLVAGCIYLSENSLGEYKWNKYISEPSRVVDYIAKEVAQDVYDSVEKIKGTNELEVDMHFKKYEKDDKSSTIKLTRPEDE